LVTSFTCIAPGNGPFASSFTIPPWVLLTIPPVEAYGAGLIGTLTVTNALPPVRFAATGLDIGFLDAYTSSSQYVTYAYQ
jgi:hypothetical protein